MTGRAVLVVGMHRSGTSALTRLINLLGVPLIHSDALIGAGRDNPAGFWESKPLARLNDRILQRLDAHIYFPPAKPIDATDTRLTKFSEEARHLLHTAPAPWWLWKDPRLCLTLPFWKETIDRSPIAVLVHRHPFAVSRSLAVRNGLSPQHGVALWEMYTRAALEALRGMAVAVVRFESLLSDPDRTSDLLKEFLRENGVPVLAEGSSSATSELQPSLDHSTTPTGARSVLSPDQQRLCDFLEALPFSSSGFDVQAPPMDEAGLAVLADQRVPREWISKLEAELVDRTRDLRRAREHIDELRGALAKGPAMFGARALLAALPGAVLQAARRRSGSNTRPERSVPATDE